MSRQSSPFLGINPFIESQLSWIGFHGLFLGELVGLLNQELPEDYLAYLEERCYVSVPRQASYPDVVVLRTAPNVPREGKESGGVAVAERPVIAATSQPTGTVRLAPLVRERFVAIRDLRRNRAVVLVIELLSPANKDRWNPGHASYLRNQQTLLESETHLVELDFLRQGEHTVAAPKSELQEWGSWDHLVVLHKAGADSCDFWLNSLESALSDICLPLAQGEPCVGVALQEVYERVWVKGAFWRELDYQLALKPALTEERVHWLAGIIGTV
ncbi:DUF4058 family protein [Armatimonas sp.]|uniref:DUF4058 family protein n=1 Tax=Armatimonas sp. TaxID=1872638 RepID=UPI00374FFBFE